MYRELLHDDRCGVCRRARRQRRAHRIRALAPWGVVALIILALALTEGIASAVHP